MYSRTSRLRQPKSNKTRLPMGGGLRQPNPNKTRFWMDEPSYFCMVLDHARFNKSVTGSWLKKSLGAGVTFGGTTHFTPLFECEAADQRLDHMKSDETSTPLGLEQWEPEATHHPSGWTPQQIEPVHILPAIDLATTFEWPVVFAVLPEWHDKTCTIDFVSTGPHGAQLVGLSSCLDLRTIPTLHSEFSTVVLSVLDRTLAKVGELRVSLSVKRRPASGVASPACRSTSQVKGACGRTLPLSPASPARGIKVARALRGRWLHPTSYTVISFPDHLDVGLLGGLHAVPRRDSHPRIGTRREDLHGTVLPPSLPCVPLRGRRRGAF